VGNENTVYGEALFAQVKRPGKTGLAFKIWVGLLQQPRMQEMLGAYTDLNLNIYLQPMDDVIK